MIKSSLPTLLACMLVVACGPTARVDLPPTHPAHANAEESPVPTPSAVLAIGLSPTDPLPAPAHDHDSQHSKPGNATAAPADAKPADAKPAGEDHSQHQKPGKVP